MILEGINEVYTGEIFPTLSSSLKQLDIDSPEAEQVVPLIDKTFSLSSEKTVKKLQFDEEGKVDISRGYYFHTIPVTSSKESIKCRAKYGILPTERFGCWESAEEMRFCVGVSYCDDLKEGTKLGKRYIGDPKYNFWDEMLSQTGRVSFIIDPSITDESLEFLSYIDGKQPKTEEEKRIFEFVESLSPKAKEIVKGLYKTSYSQFNWRAIVGGIPPQFVVGVFINTDYQDGIHTETEEEKAKCLQLAQFCADTFNCPLVNQEGRCIYQAEKHDLSV